MPRQVSLFSCQDVFDIFVSIHFKRGENGLEEVEKFCYLGGMSTSYVAASEAVCVRIGSA